MNTDGDASKDDVGGFEARLDAVHEDRWAPRSELPRRPSRRRSRRPTTTREGGQARLCLRCGCRDGRARVRLAGSPGLSFGALAADATATTEQVKEVAPAADATEEAKAAERSQGRGGQTRPKQPRPRRPNARCRRKPRPRRRAASRSTTSPRSCARHDARARRRFVSARAPGWVVRRAAAGRRVARCVGEHARAGSRGAARYASKSRARGGAPLALRLGRVQRETMKVAERARALSRG